MTVSNDVQALDWHGDHFVAECVERKEYDAGHCPVDDHAEACEHFVTCKGEVVE